MSDPIFTVLEGSAPSRREELVTLLKVASSLPVRSVHGVCTGAAELQCFLDTKERNDAANSRRLRALLNAWSDTVFECGSHDSNGTGEPYLAVLDRCDAAEAELLEFLRTAYGIYVPKSTPTRD